MRFGGIVLCAAVIAAAVPCAARGQTPSQELEQEAIESDSDPTRPVFFSLRPEFYSVNDGVEQRTFILRYDTLALGTRRILRGSPGVILRFEVPLVGADVRGEPGFGLGDAYAQFFVVPYVKGRFIWAVGSGFVIPTATDDLTGGGKWVLAPVVAPLWRLSRGLFFIKFQNYVSVAGKATRPDLNYLLVTPTFIHVVHRDWWILADSETRTKWTDDGRTGVKSGLQLGRRIAQGVGLWMKPELWWGPNRDGEWNLKFGLVWYQRRTPVPDSHSEMKSGQAR